MGSEYSGEVLSFSKCRWVYILLLNHSCVMRKDIWILFGTALVVANMYYDNMLVKRLRAWKKYYRMGGVAIFGILLFLFCRRNPSGSRALLENANDLVRLMPIDRGTSTLLSPILH